MTNTPPTVTDGSQRVAEVPWARGDGRTHGLHRLFQLCGQDQRRGRGRIAGVLLWCAVPLAERSEKPITSIRSPTTRSLCTAVSCLPWPTRCLDQRPMRKTCCRSHGCDGPDVDHSQVHDPRAYLLQVVTDKPLIVCERRFVVARTTSVNGCPSRLTSPDVADDVEFADNISIAMLTVLETLGPTERVVFVLREVFGAPYDEIAEAIGKSTVAVRQIARRARDHVVARRPRSVPISRSSESWWSDSWRQCAVVRSRR